MMLITAGLASLLFWSPLSLIIFSAAMAVSVLMLGPQSWLFPMEGGGYDFLSWGLTALSLIVLFLMALVWGKTILKKGSQLAPKLLTAMTGVLILAFLVKTYLLFYTLFELSLIPIFWLIMGWGGQPERLSAALSLLMYTVCASLPLLLFIFAMSESGNGGMLSLSQIQVSSEMISSNNLITLSVIAAFLVKFPLFGVHLWLPKAHVEAPVTGSMVLAALLLKLGGYGLLRLSPQIPFSSLPIQSLQVFTLCGGVLIGILCVRQKDMKVLIAYSSVSHMALVISACLMGSALSVKGAVLLMLAHGIASSALFAAANLPYERTHSRNTLLSSRGLSIIPLFSLFWFVFCLGNMGGPPSVNLLSEIFSIMGVFNQSWTLAPLLGGLAFLAVLYSLLLYSLSQHGQSSCWKAGSAPLSSLELNMLGFHAFFIFLAVWVFELFC